MTTWNPSDKAAAITLSGSNLTATSGGSSIQNVRSTTSKSSGLIYFECTMSTAQTNCAVGFSTAAYSLTSSAGLGGDVESAGYYVISPPSGLYVGGNFQYANTAGTSGEIIYFALDFTHSKVWISATHMRSAATPWNWGAIGSQNPATNTGGISISGMTSAAYYVTFNDETGGAVATVNFGGSAFNGTIPTGFTAWDSAISGTLTSTTKKLTANVAASVGERGTLSATTKKLTANMSGTWSSSNSTGTVSATLKKITASMTGFIPVSGSLAASVKKLVSNVSGGVSQPVGGTMAATVKKLTANASGGVYTPIGGTVLTTNETNYATQLFYVAEISLSRPGTTSYTFTEGHGTTPRGTLAQFTDGAVSGTSIQYVSDSGYVTDDNPPVVYPPFIAEAFQIDRKINLPPVNASIGASWGSLNLSNIDNQYSSLVSAWNNDGRNLNILYGTKTFEDFDGYRAHRNTNGSYVGSDGFIHVAPANTTRFDYSTGIGTILNEVAATQLITNAQTNPFSSNGDSTVTTSTAVSSLDGSTVIKLATTSITGSPVLGFYSLSLNASTTYVASVWIYIPSGQAITSVGFEWESAGINVNHVVVANVSKVDVWQRISTYGFCSAAGSKNIVLRASAGSTGIKVYATCPQIEVGSIPSSYIISFSSATVRGADNIYRARRIFLNPPYSALKSVFKGVQTPWFLSDSALQINLRDASYWLDRPLQTNLYLGTGSYNGTASLTGLPLPMTRGGTSTNPVCNVPLVLIDPVNLIYQYNDAPGTVVNLYQGGALVNTFQANTTNLYSGSTTAGMYRTDNSRGLVQLGSIPTAQMTADVTGAFPSGSQGSPIGIAYKLLTESMGLPSQYYNAGQWGAAIVHWDYAAGFFYSTGDTPTGIDAVNQILFGMGAKLYPARDGTLKTLVLRAPSGTAVAQFDISNTISVVPVALDSSIDPPPFRVRVGFNHNYTVQQSGLLGAATAAHTQVVAIADQLAGYTSAAIQTNYLRPNDLAPITGSLLDGDDAQTVANDLGALWCVRRRLYDVTVPISVGLLRDIGDIVTLVWALDNLSGGQIGIVVGETFNSTDATVILQILV